ncbi:MAG: hypothetical protein Q8M26_08925 [Pseudolabrys sp.]|nr:hypothetical protein [Pseudolabrys sp.]
MRTRLLSRNSPALRMTVDQLRESLTVKDRPWGRVLSKEEVAENARARAARHDLSTFTDADKLAIMAASADIRHQMIWHVLRREYSASPFTWGTFAGLRERGLAARINDGNLHTLTPAASELADLIADELVETRDVHSPYTSGKYKTSVTLRCTCGWSCAIVAGDRMHLKTARAHSEHMTELKAKRALLATADANATALAPYEQGAERQG